MQNFVQPGEVVSFTADADYSSGDPVLIGGLPAVVCADVAEDATGEAKTKGVFTLPKVSAEAWVAGDRVYLDVSEAKLTNVKTADTVYFGIATEDAANPSATGKCLLNVGYPQAATVAANATADGSDLATTQALANSLKVSVNAILTSLKAADIMADA